MSKILSEIQKEAYISAIGQYLKFLVQNPQSDEVTSQQFVLQKEKLKESIDKLCEGTGSIRGIRKIIYGKDTLEKYERENKHMVDSETVIGILGLFAEKEFRELYAQHLKSKIILDEPYKPFVQLMTKYYKRERRKKIREIKRSLEHCIHGKSLHPDENQYLIKK